ncbi:MAG: arylsulfatase [Rikenellaceae bacterium]
MNQLKFIATAATCLTATTALQAKQQTPPNVVFIMVDDIGYGDLSCYGAELVSTPNLDKLAAEGRQFVDAHSASSVSTPSRYSMLTGEYPSRGAEDLSKPAEGIWNPLRLNAPMIIPTDKMTVGKVMQQQGYKTACIGKWHLGWGDQPETDWNKPLSPSPNDVGFDYYFGIPHVTSTPPYFFVRNREVVGYDPNDPILRKTDDNPAPIAKTQIYPNKGKNIFTGGAEAHALYKDNEMGIKMVEESVQWITENKENPFFLYLATPHIHHPFTPGDKFVGSSKAGIYGDYIQELDWVVGEVMECLSREGIDKNTLVIFTSDNGGMLNNAGQAARDLGHKQNGDLLGFKFDVWDGGHTVPFIARWPKMIKAGTKSDQVISNVDLMATMAALTGYKLNDGEAVDSYNMLEAFTGNPKKMLREEFLLTSFKKTHQGIRMGDWVYIPAKGNGGWIGGKRGTHIFGGPKAIEYAGQENSDIKDGKIKPDAPKAQLYNVKEDRSQTKNVINDYPEIAAKMEKRLREMQQSDSTR